MATVDLPPVKAAAALLVGSLSFVGLVWDLRGVRIAAACVGIVLPAIYLVCYAIKRPLARYINRVHDRLMEAERNKNENAPSRDG